MNWFAAELHCHTRHSDGQFTVQELIETAKQHFLDGIALTDHNTVSGWGDLPAMNGTAAFPVLKGIEWTTYFGHMLVTGCPVYVDWRDALPGSIDAKIAEIRSFGGLAGIAHPFELGSPMCTGCFWDYDVRHWENVNYIEVWSKPVSQPQTANERAVSFWSGLLDRGCRIAASYGLDWHGSPEEGEPAGCTWLGTENPALTEEDMKKALLGGRTAVSTGPKFLLEATQGFTACFIGDTIRRGETTFRFLLDTNARAEVWQGLNIMPRAFRLVTNKGLTVSEIPVGSGRGEVTVHALPGWYRGECLGAVSGKERCISMTSPLYCE